MPLLRKSTLDQLKKMQKNISKDRASYKGKKKLHNLLSWDNPIIADMKKKRKIATIDQHMKIDIPENSKNENNTMKKDKLNENGTNDTPIEIMRNMKTIKNWFEYTKSANPVKERGIIVPGKQITVGDIDGIINRVEGNSVFIETLNKEGINIVEVPIKKVLKAYKPKKEKTEIKADLSLQGPNNASKTTNAKEDKAKVKKLEDKAKKAKDQKISDKINKVKKFKDWK